LGEVKGAMEQTVEIRYWRRPWLNALGYSLLNLVALAGIQYESISRSVRYGQALPPVTVFFYMCALLYFICFFFVMASKNLCNVSIDGEHLLLKRRMGRTIKVNIREAAICRDKLYVGTFLSFKMNDIVDKERLKDILSKCIRSLPRDTRAFRLIAWILAAIYMIGLIAVMVLSIVYMHQPLADIFLWVMAGLFSGISIGSFLYTIWSLARK
jgi:hypothetical protein